MAGESKQLKRKTSDTPVSPPTSRRKIQSSTTQNAVASFFTPASQKPPEKTIWNERSPHADSPTTLLVGRYEKEKGSDTPSLIQANTLKAKIAVFDFDSTLIQTSSGKKFASEAQDWKWWHTSVPGILRKLYVEDGYRVIILSNQAGITLKQDGKAPKSHQTRLVAFKSKASAVFNHLDIPISIYAATEKDRYRKPRTGMWTEMLEDFDLTPDAVDLEHSMFVGDAAGRVGGAGVVKDFSNSDRDFAENVGITFYTPEEFFLKQVPREFRRTFDPAKYVDESKTQQPKPFSKKNDQDLVLLCGSPGAGKSTFYWKYLEPLGYMRVNQDLLKTRDKCIKVADEYLSDGRPVVVDNTNADPDVRSKWIEVASKHKIPIRCILFLADASVCEHNDAVRALSGDVRSPVRNSSHMNPEKRSILPKLAFTGFNSRYRAPQLSEGFQDITEVKFKFQGTDVERNIWTRFWI